MKRKWKKAVLFSVMTALMMANMTSFAEDTESRKLSVLRSDGENAYVKKTTSKKFAAKAGMNLGEGNQVLTGKASYIYIEADDDKTMKLDSNTNVSVEKASPKSLKVVLNSGKLFFNVENPLAEDEEMEFKAAHTSMSIRGTSGYFQYDPMELSFHLYNGKVWWDMGDDGAYELNAGQRITLERDWGDELPGPGSGAGYVFSSISSFTWEDLEISELKTVLENLDAEELEAIGLNSIDALKAAKKKIEDYEEQKRKEAEERWRALHDHDDDDEEFTPTEDGELTDDGNLKIQID